MRKILPIVISTLVLLVLPTQVQAAPSPKAGAACTKLNQTQIYKNLKFTCIKSGKKLLWNKGQSISILIPPTPTPTTTPSPASTPETVQTQKKLGDPCLKEFEKIIISGSAAMCTQINGNKTWENDTFENLVNSWKSIQKYKSSQKIPNAALDFRYSLLVNTKISNSIIESFMSASQFWQEQYLPSKPIPVLFFTEKDRNWFGQQMLQIGLDEKCIDQQLTQFDGEVKRNGEYVNAAGYAGCGDTTFFDFYIGTARVEIGLNELKVGAHEYTHSGQFGALTSKGADFAPCWFIEGGAEFYGTVLGARNENDLKASTVDQVWGGYYLSDMLMGSRDQANLEAFIEENGINYNHQVCGPNGAYPVGAQATAYLYLLKGQVGILDFMSHIKTDHDFKLAIQNVYGISWEQMKKDMAAYIHLVIAQTPKN